MFWKRFYFVAALLSCNCFLLCGSWSFCERLKNIFGCGSSKTEDDTNTNLNNSNDNEGSLNNKENNNGTFSGENNNNNLENQHSNYNKYNALNDLNNDDDYDKNIFSMKNGDIKDSDSLYDNLEDVDFSTLEPSNEQEGLYYDFYCIFCSATNCAAGKTNIINVANNDKNFDEEHSPTVGVDFTTSYFKTTNNKSIKLQVWEAASEEKYQSVAANYYNEKNAIIFVYDICNPISFNKLKKNQIEEVKKRVSKNTLFFLLGNKLDRTLGKNDYRAITTDEVKSFAEENGLIFLGECSARNNKYIPVTGNTCYKEEKMKDRKYCPDNVTGIFKDILYNIVKKQKPQGE